MSDKEKNQAAGSFFSQAALDKLRSPEKLDTMVHITGPMGWMGLAAVCILCFSIVLRASRYGLLSPYGKIITGRRPAVNGHVCSRNRSACGIISARLKRQRGRAREKRDCEAGADSRHCGPALPRNGFVYKESR